MDKTLSEKQFNFLKALCENETYIMLVPAVLDEDPEELKEKHRAGMTDIRELAEMGFIENITDKFQEMLDIVKKEGARGFEAFLVTADTARMFTPGANIQ